MSEHRHKWQIRFTQRNIYNRTGDYWYVFTCQDWRCPEKRTVDRGKFWWTPPWGRAGHEDA